jgi:hypothetical protein
MTKGGKNALLYPLTLTPTIPAQPYSTKHHKNLFDGLAEVPS